MGWKDDIANEISQNAFLKRTENFDALSSYVKKEIDILHSELLEKSRSGGSLATKSSQNKANAFDHTIPYVNGRLKGFQVQYNNEASVVIISSIDDENETLYTPLVSIEPHSGGAIVKFADGHENAGKEERITLNSLDTIFEKALT